MLVDKYDDHMHVLLLSIIITATLSDKCTHGINYMCARRQAPARPSTHRTMTGAGQLQYAWVRHLSWRASNTLGSGSYSG